MITVVSLNPSIDRTLTLDEFRAGQTNRARSVRVDAGGKGVNVCLHLKALGAKDVRCTGFMRQADEAMFTDALTHAGVCCEWLSMPGHVRTNTKLCCADGGLTEINEAGESVPEEMTIAMLERCRRLFAESGVVVLTGSVPPGVPKDIYAQLTHIARENGAVCLMDSDGEALRLGLEAKPDFIKPNRAELERLLQRALPDEDSLMCAADHLQTENGVSCGCISLGDSGAVFFSDGRLLKLPALNVPVRSTVGAGDAMLAAFALAFDSGMGESDAFCLATAAGAVAVCTEGTQPVSGDLVRKLLKYTPSLLTDISKKPSLRRSVAVIGREGAVPVDETVHQNALQQRIREIFRGVEE